MGYLEEIIGMKAKEVNDANNFNAIKESVINILNVFEVGGKTWQRRGGKERIPLSYDGKRVNIVRNVGDVDIWIHIVDSSGNELESVKIWYSDMAMVVKFRSSTVIEYPMHLIDEKLYGIIDSMVSSVIKEVE